ncbi:GNAT family N-acetyltransferase [Noviherbaspirillum sp. UKPF54]|nr:GNAT family N-acetyltransferase [Noviherbaspirillum sp. UKPF54]
MSGQDVAAVLRIQSACYAPSMVEAEETIRQRLREFPGTAWVAQDEQGICGYLVAYPSRVGNITPLGATFGKTDAADTLYLHDLAVAPRAKGQGVAKALAGCALEQARLRGLRFSALVSVQDSRAFWRALGYETWDALPPQQQACLLTYEGQACYMVKRLRAGPAQRDDAQARTA